MITDPDGDAKKTRAELLATNARGDLSVTDFKSLYKTKLAGNNFSLAKMYQTVLAEENKEKGINYFSVAVDVVKEFFTSMDSTYDIVKRVFKRANEENIPSEKIPDIAKEEINNQLQAENPKYTLEDLEFTATESGMTIEEVLKALRTKEGR